MAEFLGLTREKVYSPGRVADDAAILRQTAAQLRAAGHQAEVCDSDEDTWPAPSRDTVVFTMAQGPRAIERTQAWAEAGVRVINHPQSILNCQRHRTIPRLQTVDVGLPATVLIAAGDPTIPFDCSPGVWVKRGDVHATEEGDVTYASDEAAVRAALADFRRRGVERAALQRHVSGRVLKFYGVAGSFFHCVPPSDGGTIDSATIAQLTVVARRAATSLGVEVFGGDAVWDSAGDLHIIDLNDWPSYRACLAEAAPAIAHYLASTADTGTP